MEVYTIFILKNTENKSKHARINRHLSGKQHNFIYTVERKKNRQICKWIRGDYKQKTKLQNGQNSRVTGDMCMFFTYGWRIEQLFTSLNIHESGLFHSQTALSSHKSRKIETFPNTKRACVSRTNVNRWPRFVGRYLKHLSKVLSMLALVF